MRNWMSNQIARRPVQLLLGVGLLGLAGISLGAYLSTGHLLRKTPAVEAVSIACETVGGALLAAVVVGFLVDQLARHKLSRETGEQWLWALLGEDTPPALRERAKEVISHGQAHLSVTVKCRMDWVDGKDGRVLRLRAHVLTDGVNHSRSDNYIPDGPAWAIPSVGGHRTRYLKWAFEVGDRAGAKPVRRLEADDGRLTAHSQEKPPDPVDFEPDGSIFLYQGELVDDIGRKLNTSRDRSAAAPGERFRLERELELFLDPTDFFPFFILVPTVGLNVKFVGDACKDLAIKARTGGTQLEQHPDDSGIKEFVPAKALLPGHVVIFSWHPLAREEDQSLADAAKKDEAEDQVAGLSESVSKTPA